jgi:elongation factor P
MTGSVLEKNIQSYGKIENAHVEKKEMQYLYNDGSLYYIMDSETFRADSR